MSASHFILAMKRLSFSGVGKELVSETITKDPNFYEKCQGTVRHMKAHPPCSVLAHRLSGLRGLLKRGSISPGWGSVQSTSHRDWYQTIAFLGVTEAVPVYGGLFSLNFGTMGDT